MENLSFPIGKYEPQAFSELQLKAWIADIQFLPQHIENALLNLDEAQLNTPYRPGGWTVKQLVHHVADSHMNAFIRFKLGLTENNPTIKPYEQDEWVTLADVSDIPVNVSVTLLHALHTRWAELLKNIKGEQWNRTVVHPEHGRQMSLWFLLGMYAWHSRHHTAHITALRERMGW
ncbi:MAG TPA: putative metal-dependent hydrolase [Ferruginibacter sp.]|nr:putative metal-dependent hydrolase [Ferruginibacter sp.]HMP20895.1 putative metal-dependent hydrolase [Ferruginibacter sp.]